VENELTRAAKNTDREIWRRKSPDSLDPDGYYQPSIHVTEGGGIGMNVGGTVVVMPIEQWHQLALRSKQQAERTPLYPRPCGVCPGTIESESDLEWHGLGNCVPICESCDGSGIRPDADKVKESYDQQAVGIIKNLSMLVRRLAYKHHNEKLVTQAMNYLRGEGLQGNILRDAPAAPPLAEIVERMEKLPTHLLTDIWDCVDYDASGNAWLDNPRALAKVNARLQPILASLKLAQQEQDALVAAAYRDEKQVKHMVDRFLGWRLPENFNPDGGISFEPLGNRGTEHEYKRQPVGTNVLDATQAEVMVRYMIDGMPSAVDARAALAAHDAEVRKEATSRVRVLLDNWIQLRDVKGDVTRLYAIGELENALNDLGQQASGKEEKS